MDEPRTTPDSSRGLSFGAVAEAYDRGRPGFPPEAARWLTGPEPAIVLELGAGTGKLTRELVALGHDVHATDPDAAMLAVLQRHLPDVPTSVSGAEEIPLPDHSVDVVVAAQAFHWFDLDRALPEIARVLRPGGHVAAVWNTRNEQIPWVRKLGRILTAQPGLEQATTGAVEALAASDLFGEVERQELALWQQVDRESIVDLVASRSYVSTLDEVERERTIAAVEALYADYGRGMDGMQLPYRCECYRARVVPPTAPPTPPPVPVAEREDGAGTGASEPGDGSDTDMLLIDFR